MTMTKTTTVETDKVQEKTKADIKNEEKAAEGQKATAARESKNRDENVVRMAPSARAQSSSDPAEGPVPRSGDPYAAQRVSEAGDFEAVDDEADDKKK